MSLKDLFESTKVTKSGSADETAYEVESEAYTDAFTVDKNTFMPAVDFATASNFARYGSAEKYYEDSIVRIHDEYPYDGSRAEILEFRNSSSYLDKWVFDNRYPRTTGYVSIGTTSGSATWLTMVSSSEDVGGWGMPDTSTDNILEYIEIKAGPNTGSSDRTFEEQPSSLKKMFTHSNVYDSGSAREYNMEFNLDTGVTVEFWLSKNAFYTTKTEREVVFDLWNNENSSSSGYGRLMIELSGGADAGSAIRLTAQSGTSGFVNEPIASITPSDIADGVWKHYAVTLKNSPSSDGVNAKLYVNGQVSGSSLLGSETLGRVTGSLVATIGALAAPPSGATGYYDTTTIVKGGAKLSASMDEFRYWKLERDPRQIGRNWFTQVRGGSNTDDANVGLGIYYKFNEGIVSDAARDNTILDYSGRVSNGWWRGGVSSVRNTGSALVLGSHSGQEYHDPIIYSGHPEVQALKDDMIPSGAYHDNRNNSMLHSGFPAWTSEESNDSTMKEFTQIIGSYFDKLHLQIESVQKIKERYGSSYSENVYSTVYKPIPFADKLVSQFGIVTPELLQEAEMIENFLNRNEKMEYGEKLADIRNQIYSNIYANLLYIFKSKGTEKSFRNMLRCFGIDDELVKINVYSDMSDYTFKDNRRNTTNKTNYISFSGTDRFDSTVYQAISMSVDGIYDNPNTRPYITGSSGFGEFNAQTLEAEIYFPLKPDNGDFERWYQDSFVTSSLFGVMGANESLTDLSFPTTDNVDLRVFAIKDELESTRVQFMASSSVLGTLTSSFYEDVYDDTRWNFAVRVKPSKSPWVDHISGSITGDAQTFDVEFYGTNVFTDVVQHEFLSTTTVSETIGKAFLSSPKRCYVGALRNHFTSSEVTLHQTNVDVGNLRYWMSDISDDVVLSHAMDQSSFGVSSPYKSVFLYESSMSGTFVPQIETLALHWNFDNVTGSGPSPTAIENTYDAQFIVQDISSGSAESADRYGSSYGGQVKMQHLGIGDFFLENKTDVVNTRYIPTAKIVLPEYLHSSDMVEIRKRDDEFFTRETRPSKVVYSIEKSMYQTISEEMIKMFSTIKDFDNLIGEPVNRYRAEYKDLGKLRQLFFEKIPNSPDLDKYVDYYKWIDSAISRFLEQLMPASAMASDGLRTMVESHVLERSKYQTKYPSMEFQGDPPIGAAEGINKLLYNYEKGSAPLPADVVSRSAVSTGSGSAEMMDQDENCLWWNKRAEREHPILASTAMSASSPALSLSGTLDTRIAIFSASAQTFKREWTTPYKYSAVKSKLIHGGVNFDDNKNLGYVYPATVPFSPRPLDYGIYGGYPLGYLLAKDMDLDASPAKSLPNCDTRISSSYGDIVKREGYKVIDGWETFKSNTGGETTTPSWGSASYTTFRGNLVMPFNVISSSQYDVCEGYTQLIDQDLTVFQGSGVGHSDDAGTYVNHRGGAFYDAPATSATKVGGLGQGVNLVNLHTDTYGEDKESPMQGPFTEKYVGGRKFRHADINDGTDTLSTREEGYLLLVSTAMSYSSGVINADSGAIGLVGPDYPYPHGPYPFQAGESSQWRPIGGRYFRDETAKRPINIRNIQMVTQSASPTVIGAHRHDTVTTDGDDESLWAYTTYEQTAPGSARTIIGNYRHNYEVVHTVGRSNQKPFLRDNQSVRNILQTGSFAEVPSLHGAGTNASPRALGGGTGTMVPIPSASLPATTHVETILTQKFQASSSTVSNAGLPPEHQLPTDPTNTVLQGARVIVAQVSGGVGGANAESAARHEDNYVVLPTADEHIHMDFTVQNRETGSTNLNTIFANRFSAPGGPRNQSKGFLDLAAEEYSVYNAYPWRNLEVLGSSSGEYLSTHAQIHSSSVHPRLGLRSLRAMPSGRFGVEWGTSEDTEIIAAGPNTPDQQHDYGVTPSWHKVNRNPRLEHRAATEISGGGDLQPTARTICLWMYSYSGRVTFPADSTVILTDVTGSKHTYKWVSGEFAANDLTTDPVEVGMFTTGSGRLDAVASLYNLGQCIAGTTGFTVSDMDFRGDDDQSESTLRYFITITFPETGTGANNLDYSVLGNYGGAPHLGTWCDKGAKSNYFGIADHNGFDFGGGQGVTGTLGNGARVGHTEKTVYDNDYITRPIPQNDYQYAWISASLAPSGANSSYHNLGHGYHLDAYRHPTVSGSRPVDPILFNSASDAGSAIGDGYTHTDADDRGFRYFGIDRYNHYEHGPVNTYSGRQHIPNVQTLNLNLREEQNTWLTDASGAVALGFFASGGILPADDKQVIGANTNDRRGGFAYGSRIGSLHNYLNGTFLFNDGRESVSGIGPTIHNSEKIHLQGAFVGDSDGTSPDLWDNEKIRYDVTPMYWSGSAATFTHENVDFTNSSTDHQHYAINQSVASIFNSLMWKRNGPYGYPTWKQIRTGEHILAQTMRKNNRYVLVDPQSDRIVNPPPGKTSGRIISTRGMIGTDAVAAARRTGHINTAERKHNHYYVPVADSSAKSLIVALQVGSFSAITDSTTVGAARFVSGEGRSTLPTVTYSIIPENMLYVNATYQNNLRNFPVSALNTDLGIRDYKSDRTAYDDLYEMYTDLTDLDGNDAYTLADLIYRQTIFPKAENVGRQDTRQRARFSVGYWASDADADLIPLTDSTHLEPYYDPTGRRTFFDHPDPTQDHSVWEFYRGENASVNRMYRHGGNWKTYSVYAHHLHQNPSVSRTKNEKKLRNRASLAVSASIWPMDGGTSIESLTGNDGTLGSAQYRASASADVHNTSFGMYAEDASARTHGAPGILQNQYTWFHNGLKLGYEPLTIGTGLSANRDSVVSSSALPVADYNIITEKVGTERFDENNVNISERYVEFPAAGMAFGPSYSRPHMMVGRDSYCSPSAGKAAYSRRFLFASETAALTGAATFGKGDGLDPFFAATEHPAGSNSGSTDATFYAAFPPSAQPQLYATIPFTASVAPGSRDVGDRAISQLTRSIGHQVEGLYVSDWEWKAPAQSGKSPFYANYADWFEELRGKSQDRQVIPEYRISDRIRHFVLDKQGRFTSKDKEWLSLIGNPSSSAGSLTGSSDSLSIGSTVTASFMTDYAVTAKAGLFDAIKTKHAGVAEPYELTLTCDAILKFLPYQGFYPQLRTVDLCKQFVDSYDEHVTFESDLSINDKPSAFVRADSSGSIIQPTSGDWWGFNPWATVSYGSYNSGESKASALITFDTTDDRMEDGDNIVLTDADGTAITFEFTTDNAKQTAGGMNASTSTLYYFRGGTGAAYSYSDAYWFKQAVNDAGALAIVATGPSFVLAFSGNTKWRVTLTAAAIGTSGNTTITDTGIDDSEVTYTNFTGGTAPATMTLHTAQFYSSPEKEGYTFDVDEIVDPTSPRAGGSGKLTKQGFETHGRNAAAAKRPFYGPFMAPGILFNTIKSGIAVDYPILNRQLATTASVDRDGGRNYQILNEYFDNRLPFETLVEPEKYLTNVPLVDMEPHPSASLNVTASWDGQGDPLYKMMMHNFLAEIPNFYLANQQMQSFTSLPEGDGNFGQVETVIQNGEQIIPEYRMMVKVWKSQESSKTPVAPSSSNHWQNHRGALHPIKTRAHDGTASGSLALLGAYEPCYYTDVIGMSKLGQAADGGYGMGAIKDDYQSPVGVKYNRQESGYPRPQRDAPETITMYSRPSAFGPPSAGGYAFQPELEHIYTGSAAPMSMSYGAGAGGHVAGENHVGKVADRISTTYGMKDGTNGYNAPFTPPYYDGQAWAFVTFKPTRTGKHYLDEIWENTTINFLRYEFNYVSGAYGDWGTVGPQGYAMNVNAMQVDATVNIKGKTSIKEVTYDAVTGLPRTVSDSLQSTARNSAWVIQTKFETPILHFGYGVTDNQSALTLSGSDSDSAMAISNGYHHGYPGLCEPIGMWHQYGEIPSASQGIYLEVADIPANYLRYGTEMTIANPKWLHITGSPDVNAGCTANLTTWHADGDPTATLLRGSPDWDGYVISSSAATIAAGSGYADIAATHLPGYDASGTKRYLKGQGYRFSGSFSGSEKAYIVGRDTLKYPDAVRAGTLQRGGRQQYMRWRLMSTGSLAGIIADRTHLQLISADNGIILDTTWGCPMTRTSQAAPGISGSGPCYERGFYITSDVTGSNIISGSVHAGGVAGGAASPDNLETYLNRGYPGTSSARQRLMGIGKLTGSFGDGSGPIPYRTYYTQWQYDVPNNPKVDKVALAAAYQSPLHKNKRGIIPEEPHFSNNISSASFGTDIGCSLYATSYDNTHGERGSLVGYITWDPTAPGTASAGGGGNFSHIGGSDIHYGPLVGQPIEANSWDESAPISNSLGVGRAEIICGYTGSTGRYPHPQSPKYAEWVKSIDGPLSGSSPRFVNSNHRASRYTHGETAYQRWSSDYFGAAGSASTNVAGTAAGVNGFHENSAGARVEYFSGLEDIYPLGMMGGANVNRNNGGQLQEDMYRMDPIKMWYTNPVHIANVRMQDMFYREELIDSSISSQARGDISKIPALHSAVCSPRTVPSGKFLPVGGIQALTKSLGSLVGFNSGAKKLGQLAETRTVKEAVVVMPYVMKNNRRLFTELDTTQIDRYFARGDYSDTGYWAALENTMDLKGAATSPKSGLQVNLGKSVFNQIRQMEDYVFPPHLDFTLAKVRPYAMYIFEYEHQFSAQDLSDMWQGLFPDSGKVMKQVTKQVTHKLNVLELLGASTEDGEKVPDQIRFMVFKVKQRAEINYFAKTSDAADDSRFKFKFKAGESRKRTDYSYNWPYDFFSIVETAKIDLSISLRNKKLIDSVELQELNPDIPTASGTHMTISGIGSYRTSAPSLSEESVRSARRQATTQGVIESVGAAFGSPTRL